MKKTLTWLAVGLRALTAFSLAALIHAVLCCLSVLPMAIDDHRMREGFNAAYGLRLFMAFLPLPWVPWVVLPLLIWLFYHECGLIQSHLRCILILFISGYLASGFMVLWQFCEGHLLFIKPEPPTDLAVRCNVIVLCAFVSLAIARTVVLRRGHDQAGRKSA